MPVHPEVTAVPVGAALVSVNGKAYPLEAARLEARTEGGIASTALVQSYANPYDEPLEVLYTLPLPADGAVLGYTIRIGERLIRGEVQPRERAEETYRKALYEGRTAGLLEQTRPDTFQQRLGNVPPRTSVEVSIEVLHPLAFLPGVGTGVDAVAPEWEYRFPTVVGVRYLGEPGRVSDAAELSPDRARDGQIPTRCELFVTIAADVGVLAHSPSHSIACEDVAEGARVSFGSPERLDRDVVVRWAAAGDAVGARVVEGRGLPGDDGRYALVTITPPATPGARFRRDLTVLIDASGSMDGPPLELARRVAGDLLRGLDPGDRFELLAFSNDVRRLTGHLRAFDERALREALVELRGLQAGGGTEMATALTEALAPQREDSQRQVVLLTDGFIGFESEVVAEITRRENARVHIVGIGSAPNRTLTRQVAAAGRGLELFAGDETTAHEAARRLSAGTARPVLTAVTVTGTATTGHGPRLRDVFAGQPLVFALELSRAGGDLTLAGELPGETTWQTNIDVPALGAATSLASTTLPLGALHGRAVIADLELGLSARASAADTRIEGVAMRHRIASRRTSLVAIAEEPAVDPRAPRRRERLAVEIPAGVSAEGAGLGIGELSTALSRIPSCRTSSRHVLFEQASRLDLRRIGGESTATAALTADHVRWLAPDTLVIEFTVPADGLMLPDRTARLIVPAWGPDLAGIEVEIVREASTGVGPHPRGVLVKLVIRIPAAALVAPQLHATLYWTPRQGRLWPRKREVVSVAFMLPAATGTGA